MAFVLKQTDSYSWPVTVEFPVDGGRFEKQTFDVQFKRIGQDRIREIHELIHAGEIDDDGLCRELVVGWSGIEDGKGEVPYSEKALNDLLMAPLVTAAIVTSWFDSLGKARRKN